MSERAESRIEVMTLDGGGDPIYLAWGIHDPAAFLRSIEGMEDEADAWVEDVKHERWINVGPQHGMDEWYEPTAGEPNCTVLVL